MLSRSFVLQGLYKTFWFNGKFYFDIYIAMLINRYFKLIDASLW
jgi:hypothetical protein